jgi:hypothetical protein
VAPIHPAYADNSALPSRMTREFLMNEGGVEDPNKAAEVIARLASEPNPPMRLPLSLVAIGLIKQTIGSLTEDTEKYASWSENLGFADAK